MPENAGGFEYAAGFMMATALLHAMGIAVGFHIEKANKRDAVAIATGASPMMGTPSTLPSRSDTAKAWPRRRPRPTRRRRNCVPRGIHTLGLKDGLGEIDTGTDDRHHGLLCCMVDCPPFSADPRGAVHPIK